jgi:transposase
MMGRLNHEQEQFFYSFRLDDAVPGDHPVRRIAAVLDLGWVYSELAPCYPGIGRPSVDPVLMIRMLIVGYVFGIRSERELCRDVAVNLAYRWFCGLSIEDKVPDHSVFPVRAMSAFVTATFSGTFSNALSGPVSRPAWLGARALRLMRA